MTHPCDVYLSPVDEIQLGVCSTFVRLPEAQAYRRYAHMVAIWLTTYKLQQSTFSNQSGFSEAGPLDSFGFPTNLALEDDSLDSIGDDIFGSLHWSASRIHADLVDLPYSFLQIIDLHIILMYIECVLVGESFNDLELPDIRVLLSEGRNEMQFNLDILRMLDRMQSILEDDNFLHFVSIIENDSLVLTEQQSNGAANFDLDDEGYPLPYESFLSKQVDTEPALDKDGFPIPSKSSKHDQYVDCVEEIVDILTTLKTLTERRKVRSFVNRSARQIALLKEHIKMFEEIGRMPADGNLEVKEIVSSKNAATQTDSKLMQSDAVSKEDAQKQFLANATDETGNPLPPGESAMMGFAKGPSNLFGTAMQKPTRNAEASTSLSNTGMNMSSAMQDYTPTKKKGSEFFAFC